MPDVLNKNCKIVQCSPARPGCTFIQEDLETSVRASNDRRLVAAVLLLPAALITYRYRLYDAAFLRDLSEGLER